MQRRLTIALVSTALISILLVGFGVLAMAQLSARSNAERDVTRSLNVLSDFLSGPNRSPRQIETLLSGSRGNLNLESLERVAVGEDGAINSLARRRLNDNDSLPDVRLNEEQLELFNNDGTVMISDSGTVYGLRAVNVQSAVGQDPVDIAVLASKQVRPVTSQTLAWFVLSSLVVLVGALLGGYWLARRFSEPIKEIQSATAAIAAGDLAVRVDPTGSDEVTDLGHEVNRMAADLERSKALDRQFLMSVSHDLRTPLTAITGFAEGLADGAVTDPQNAGVVIGSHAARLDRLVGDLLDLARLDANRFRLNARAFDLSVLVGRTIAGLTNQASMHSITLVREGTESLMVNADPDRTDQAIANLVDNAIKFASSTIRVTVKQRENMAVVSVHDDGPGIPAQDLPHVFDRLYTGKAQPDRAENPTGLGLAIVRELAGAMGGNVEANNHPDGGALLSLALPIVAPGAEQQPADAQATAASEAPSAN
jgi:signal transduction histidine kinase